MIKVFFKGVRAVLGPLLLLSDKLFPPKRIKASQLNQPSIDAASSNIILYQFKACPFCIKVRRQLKRIGLQLETRNVLKNKSWEDELIREGGKRKVPCLRIEKESGEVEWLYNSKSINAYLSSEFVTDVTA